MLYEVITLAQKEPLIMNLDPKNLDELARKLSESVPPGLVAVRDDLERNFKARNNFV